MTTNKKTHSSHPAGAHHPAEPETEETVEAPSEDFPHPELPPVEPSPQPAERPALAMTLFRGGIPVDSALVHTIADIPAAAQDMAERNGLDIHLSSAIRYHDQAGSGNGWILLPGTDGNGAANRP